MSSSLPIHDFLEAAESLPIIDVRSPSEYKHGHIPGAHNIPLFDDEERAEIGTIYKQQNRDEAFKRGLEFVGPKMRTFVERAEEIAPERELLLNCWRGGMRSSSFGWLLESAGFKTHTLENGYKAFRNFVLDLFQKQYNILILSGYTGSGKTEILQALQQLGEQVIDLEGLANHKGSAFGHLGEDEQPSGEHFQNKLGMRLYQIEEKNPLWLEDESRFIGRRIIPNDFFKQMRKATVFRVEIPKEIRIKRLVDDYGAYPKEKLENSILKIEKRLGGLRTQQAIEALENDNLATVADYVLHYYDKAYDHGISKRDDEKVHYLPFDEIKADEIAHLLKEQSLAKSV